MMWTYPRVLAHRGAGKLAPENTMAAMRCALSHGFHAVEFDVMALKSGELVLMHDAELGRTIAGEGLVIDLSASELAQMDAGSWLAPQFAGEPVPGFAEVAQFCLAHDIWMNVEIKPAPGMEHETGRLVAAACAQLPIGRVLLSSFSFTALAAAHIVAPEVPRGLLVERVPPEWQLQLHKLHACALHVGAAFLDASTAAAVRQAGYGLFCYTVNDPAEAKRLLNMGVDAFCTDSIDVINAEFCDIN
jgi:glycerophosphoryl diester phosphodiesterase